MANKTKLLSGGGDALPLVHRNAAGIDIGSRFHVVAVPAEADSVPVRTFDSFTGDLIRLAEWLSQVGAHT